MKALKIIAIVMTVLVVAAVGIVGYFFATATVRIAAFKAEGTQAADQSAYFSRLKSEVEAGSFQGTLFSTEPLGDAEDYVFITYTVRLNNQCLVPVDMVEIQVVPENGDVLQIGDLNVHSLEARSQGDLQVTILTARDNHSVRELIVTFYVWGVSFRIQETYGG